MINTLKNIVITEHFSWFLKKGSLALVLRVVGAALGFLLHLLIARLYGPTGTGLYAIALTIIGIALILAKSGITRALLKLMSASISTDRWDVAGAIYSAALKRVFLSSLAVTIGLLVLIPFLSQSAFNKPELAVFLNWMTLAIYPQVLIVIYIQCLRSCSYIALAMMIRNIAVSFLAILVILAASSYLGVTSIPFAYFVASTLTAVTGWLMWRRVLAAGTGGSRSGVSASDAIANLRSSSNTLIWVDIFQAVFKSAPILVLSVWVESAQIGIYSIAFRIIALTGFALDAMNLIVGNRFAAFYERNEMQELSRFLRQTSVILLLAAVPMFLFILLANQWVLGLFGAEFVEGKTVLLVLSAGYFFNIVCGPMGLLLMMTGHEKSVRRITFYNVILVLVLCVFLIPELGITGAAISVAVTMVVRNLATVYMVNFYLGKKLRANA